MSEYDQPAPGAKHAHRLRDGRQPRVVGLDLARQDDVNGAVPQRQPVAAAFDDADVGLVQGAGPPRQQHGVVADAGTHVGDALARDRHDSLQRGQHPPLGIEHLAQPREQGRIGVQPGGQDGAHVTSSATGR